MIWEGTSEVHMYMYDLGVEQWGTSPPTKRLSENAGCYDG